MKKLFENHMFWIVLLSWPIGLGVLHFLSSTYTIHRTIGWGWDITSLMEQVIVFCILILGYGIVYFTGRKTNLYLSVLHSLVLLALFFSDMLSFELTLLYTLQVGSLVLFLTNVFSSKKLAMAQ